MGSFRFKAGFERIAETGSGGVGIVFTMADELTRLTFAGVIACVLILGAAFVLALKAQHAVVPADGASRRRSVASAILIASAVLLLAGSAYVIGMAERQALGTAVRFSRLTAAEPPPAVYAPIAQLSTQQWVDDLGRRAPWRGWRRSWSWGFGIASASGRPPVGYIA